MTNHSTDHHHNSHPTDHKGFATEVKHITHPNGPQGTQCHQFGTDDHPQQQHHLIKHGGFVDRAIHHHKASTTSVAIAGVTGKLGQLIAKHILANEDVVVHGITRNLDEVPEHLKSHPRVKLFQSDMTDITSMREAIKHCSILISTISTDPASEAAMGRMMVDACVAEKVPRFMPNDFTLDWRALDLDLLPQLRPKQEVFDYLEKQHGKVKGVHVLNGALVESLFGSGYLFPAGTNPLVGFNTWGTGDEIWEFTTADNAAQWVACVALDKDATGFFKFLGDRMSTKDIAKTIQDVYDLPCLAFTSKGSLDDLKASALQGLKQDPDSDDLWAWKGQSFVYSMLSGKAYLQAPLDNVRYLHQVQQQTLEDWLSNQKLEELGKVWSL